MGQRKGLLLVFTGDGKGKTTAALGMALRAWGQGMKVLIVQFIKSSIWQSGEQKAAEKLGSGLTIRSTGMGFVYEVDGDFDRHRQAAQEALGLAGSEISYGKYDLVILDEIFYAINCGLISLDDVLGLVDRKQEHVHLVLTGRNAPQEVIERADLVTEMRDIKHHFSRGIKAQKGIEF
ncbi:MAG: Cob(I)yrinic acid a,c-diamide adenosyltransferase [Pelotomaculum sp. PtaB.Bin104]|nr:MAG: Cob(I)yrinic acid a,c-diamide adenosyltransferase [Pelotomaculum sp. PtaB.Bin104]